MHGEIITIGNELISGRIVDLNAWYAAGRLTASGLHVTRITSIGDDYRRVSEALRSALASSLFVIITGGLGSTEDDMTNDIVARSLKRTLCLDEKMFENIKRHIEARGLEMTTSLEKMAWMPEGSRMINPEGTACGFSLLENDVHLYFLPGVPAQMRYLLDKFVLPEMLGLYETLPVLRQRILKLYGLNEPSIAELFKTLQGKTGNVVFGFYPNFPENHITISLRGQDEPTVVNELDMAEKEIRNIVGPYIFATENQNMEDVVGLFLMKSNMTISVAESCTGGLIGHRLTNTAGSSRYFQGGVVAYSNRAKRELLKVCAETLEKYGAVSEQTAREMSEGIREKMNTDLGLSVTGIAGPGGGTRDKPVGTVHIGLSSMNETFSGKYRFWGTREQVRLNSALMAMDCVRRYLNGNSFLPSI